jgi:hypothetical protein
MEWVALIAIALAFSLAYLNGAKKDDFIHDFKPGCIIGMGGIILWVLVYLFALR